METFPMELPEARRRFEKMLVEADYTWAPGPWMKKGHKEIDFITSKSLQDMPDTRAILWYESGDWQGMISVKVGEDGEFPLTGGRIIRDLNIKKIWWEPKSFPLLRERIDEVRVQVRRWDSTPTGSLGYVAMIRLALSYLTEKKINKAKRILLGAIRGEISSATVSESLSIVQQQWARSREERLRSALIWASVFK